MVPSVSNDCDVEKYSEKVEDGDSATKIRIMRIVKRTGLMMMMMKKKIMTRKMMQHDGDDGEEDDDDADDDDDGSDDGGDDYDSGDDDDDDDGDNCVADFLQGRLMFGAPVVKLRVVRRDGRKRGLR